ncbi:MAG: ABC transporter permease [Lachnospiraceae bacterium]|nr:ABC transporter permease [Lachnospiraceae bacterium]
MSKVKNFTKQYFVVLILIFLVLLFGVMQPDSFLTLPNMFTIIRQSSIMGVATIGLLFVMIAGGIDLSLGSVISLESVFVAVLLTKLGWGLVPAYLVGVIGSTVVGLITGLVIVKTGIFPMIGTLALQIILQGVAYLVCGGMPVSNLPKAAKVAGQGYVGIIPIPVIIFIVVIILAVIVLNRTYIGRHFYAVGSNEEAARLSGINTGKLKVSTYAIGGFLSGLAGIIMLARVSSGQPTAGKNMEMDCLTAAVIGGVSLTGGEGKISTAVCGVLIIGVLTNGMTIMNISEYYQLIIRGSIFLGAVCLDGIQKQLSSHKKMRKVS